MSTVEPITIDVPHTASAAVLEPLLADAASQLKQAGNWSALEWICMHPCTPEDVLLEMARTPQLHSVLGHRSGPPRLVEVMANEYGYPEAILTLGHNLYDNPAVTLSEFQRFVDRHGSNLWLLESLIYRTERNNSKNEIVDQACRRHAESERLWQIRQHREQIRSAEFTANGEEIDELYRAGDPKIWVALAANPNTPERILKKLVELANSPHAARIRHAAALNLKSKQTTKC